MNSNLRILYTGIYLPTSARDKVYIDALKARGHVFDECVNQEKGLAKYWNLHRQLVQKEKETDCIWVGYLSPAAVVVSFLSSRKKIIYNALASAYEAYVLDRGMYPKYSFRAFLWWTVDFLSFQLADAVLVESQAQLEFIARTFFAPRRKLHVVYTGVSESLFHPDATVTKKTDFTVAFRGILIPATGIEVVLEAAKLLKDEQIHFWISGWGQLQAKVSEYITSNSLTNVTLNTLFLEPDDLRTRMLSAHILLGQFSSNSRLDRTIQHKTSEALALGMPYITRDSVSNREILRDKENVLFVTPSDPIDLKEKILLLQSDIALRERLGAAARVTFINKLSQVVLGEEVAKVLYTVMHHEHRKNKN
ncbi:MAG: hypothetical protein A2664_00770 [Candidatus Taylorbacteria bacterium RIFCSPHIGHO2_01_FULL_46_22b]|uniref:Glycosyl transferase family 1 domain-containing protein n=1 Tax=Candidatus Taylorbacteria bacterium RIFCSPHIGHO2_01_FULL_46_22b TaxID=1802301 RepID=A0A1G2M5Z9_9BACT|nr:MAG: hypothetical protein A2664_00770 [Candidatus Taylorbacteria bacterium RIFCSPHIGHO2_01_FULL_46_22b]